MAVKKTTMDYDDDGFPVHVKDPGFDVTMEVVVGRVSLTDSGGRSPLDVAFGIIAGSAKDGVYRFPGPDEGKTTVVTVEGIE